MPTTITLADLRALDACEEQVALFNATFPHGVTVTPDNAAAVATAAVEAGLNVHWYAERDLTPAEWVAYRAAVAPARAAYRAASTPARAAYEAAWVQARATYRAAEARALCVILAVR